MHNFSMHNLLIKVKIEAKKVLDLLTSNILVQIKETVGMCKSVHPTESFILVFIKKNL